VNQEFSLDVFDVDDLDLDEDEGSNEFPLLPLARYGRLPRHRSRR